MRTDFLFEYFRPSDVLKIGCFRYLTYQEKQKMFFFVLHFVVRSVQNLSRNRGEISSIITLHLWLRCFPGQPFQKHVSPKRQETWKGVWKFAFAEQSPSLGSSFTQWSGVTPSVLNRRIGHIQSTKYISCVH